MRTRTHGRARVCVLIRLPNTTFRICLFNLENGSPNQGSMVSSGVRLTWRPYHRPKHKQGDVNNFPYWSRFLVVTQNTRILEYFWNWIDRMTCVLTVACAYDWYPTQHTHSVIIHIKSVSLGWILVKLKLVKAGHSKPARYIDRVTNIDQWQLLTTSF